MRRKGLWLSVLATALIAGSASANIINNGGGIFTYEGNGFNFFTYNNNAPSTLGTNTWNYGKVTTSPNVYRSAGTQGDGIWTSGAASLQTYDFEEAFWAYSGDEFGGWLDIGLVVGQFDADGIPASGSASTNGDFLHNAGDLFVGFGAGQPANLYAIGLSTGAGANNRIGNSWANTGSPNWTIQNPTDFPASTPWRVRNDLPGALSLTSGMTGYSTVEWTEGVNRHNFVAVRMFIDDLAAESLIGTFDNPNSGGLSLHWTMECGNDLFHGGSATSLTPVVPVPAAAPMGLLGMGLLALVRRVRRRPEC